MLEMLSEFGMYSESLIVPFAKSRSLLWMLFFLKMGTHLVPDYLLKPSYKNMIILANGFHPQSLKKGLPVSQLHRVNRICDRDENDVKNAMGNDEMFYR